MWIARLRCFGDFWSWEDAEAHNFRGYDVFSSIYLWLNYKYEETADMHSYLTSSPDENIDCLWKINGLIINIPLLYWAILQMWLSHESTLKYLYSV